MSRVTIKRQTTYGQTNWRISLPLNEDEASKLHLDSSLVTRLAQEVAAYIRDEWVPGDSPEWDGSLPEGYDAVILCSDSTGDLDFLAASAFAAFERFLSKGHPEFVALERKIA